MRRIPLLALLACAPLVASAGDEAGHFYIGPEVGGIVASGDRDTKEHDWVYGLDLGYNFTSDWTFDVNLNTVRLKDEFDPGHLRLMAASGDVLRVFNRSGMFAPYIAAGAGVLHYDTPFNASRPRRFLSGSRRRRVHQTLGEQQRLEQLLPEAGHPRPLG